jgi:two-component system response regulator RegA
MDVRTRRVLVVDQDERWRRVLQRGLAQHGFSVAQAATLRDAGDLVKREDAKAIVLDVAFPDGHGLGLVPEPRHVRPGAALLICTAHGSIAAAVAALRAGTDDFLLKPVTPGEVAASIGHARGGRQRAELPARALVPTAPMSLDRVQWEHLQRVLMDCDWNVSEAARRLGIHRQSLQRKLRQMRPNRP